MLSPGSTMAWPFSSEVASAFSSEERKSICRRAWACATSSMMVPRCSSVRLCQKSLL
ncbi:hypothetical protein R2601_03923 [Salipiger bermudensis HTCC2601]|uniref:Uncharacterized protein n=1 Tax=Salipiger bermudensis (strain DSM 26914 / JCM 13377 / KCTC 12554 / HTCC2601) TaxID=314265 RepID=Q0FW61_SALBH|nr:hypothetical protein R2601_03923 [Salipiger bermudensis HTCC2601]